MGIGASGPHKIPERALAGAVTGHQLTLVGGDHECALMVPALMALGQPGGWRGIPHPAPLQPGVGEGGCHGGHGQAGSSYSL